MQKTYQLNDHGNFCHTLIDITPSSTLIIDSNAHLSYNGPNCLFELNELRFDTMLKKLLNEIKSSLPTGKSET